MNIHMVWLGHGEDDSAVARARAASPGDTVWVWRSPEILPAAWRPAWDRFTGVYRVQSDLLRLAALRLHGGLYIDWDHTLLADAATITAGWQTLTVVAAGRGGMLPGGLVYCPSGWPHWGLVDEYIERAASTRASHLVYTHQLYASLPHHALAVVRDPARFPVMQQQLTDRAEVIRFQMPRQPTLLQKASNFAASAARHVAAGMPQASDEEVARRFAICEACEHFDGKACRKCGCPVVRERKFLSKLSWANESCPVGKW